jgi:hypothetical protein
MCTRPGRARGAIERGHVAHVIDAVHTGAHHAQDILRRPRPFEQFHYSGVSFLRHLLERLSIQETEA